MNWGSRDESHCTSTVWEKENFWSRVYTKKVLDTLSNFALKNSLYRVSTKIAPQPSQGLNQMNWGSRDECHCPRTVWEGKSFWARLYTKKYSIHCQISHSKTRYIVFQHKLLFNLVKDITKWIEGPGTRVTVQVQSERERIFDLGCIRKKVLDTLSNFALRNSLYSVLT